MIIFGYLLVNEIAILIVPPCATAQVDRVWLTHKSNATERIVINWESATPGDSVVRYGATEKLGNEVRVDENVTLHHVEIPLRDEVSVYHYRVSTGDYQSPDYTFRAYPKDELRVAVVANWHAKPKLDAIRGDDVHLLLTAGDNISDLHSQCGKGVKDCVKPYSKLIDAYPEIFRSTPFLAVLGNHDREIRPRGDKPPAEPVYDVDATAFRRFFALPDDGWKWHFDVPEFDVRFIALDLNHIQDQGTTWRTCHPFQKGSEQFEWYRSLMAGKDRGFVITLHNEKSDKMRRQESGEWHRLFRQGTAVITGFGYFAERAEQDGLPYFNTSLSGKGDKYPDAQSKFLESQDNYILMTFSRNAAAMRVELKNLDGKVLERTELPRNFR